MPAPVQVLTRDWYAYTSDDTAVYQIGTTDSNAAAQSGTVTPDPVGTNPVYPRGWVMRHVYGEAIVTGVLYRTKLPVFDPTDDIWVGATTTTFVKNGCTYNIEGRIGEKRVNKGG